MDIACEAVISDDGNTLDFYEVESGELFCCLRLPFEAKFPDVEILYGQHKVALGKRYAVTLRMDEDTFTFDTLTWKDVSNG